MFNLALTPADETLKVGKRIILIASVFISIMASALAYIWWQGHPMIEQEARQLHKQIGSNIVSALEAQIGRYEGVAWSMTAFAEASPNEEALFASVIPEMLDVESMQDVVAGGGIWPEPNLFDTQVERFSFFWGRNREGALIRFQNYNDAEGAGYHAEEWYVPVKYGGQLYWSRSYTDPYSKQIMVTVTAPIYKSSEIAQENTFWGVSTVDLRLEGMHELVQKITAGSGGYAFVVDRNGKFITFPQPELIQTMVENQHGEKTPDIITVKTLAEKEPKFLMIARFIKTLENNSIAKINNNESKYTQLAHQIDQHSYQVNPVEAKVIAANMSEPTQQVTTKAKQLSTFTNNEDMILNEKVQVSIYKMPSTHWHVVTVFPTNATQSFAKQISRDVSFFIFILVALFGLVCFLMSKVVLNHFKSVE